MKKTLTLVLIVIALLLSVACNQGSETAITLPTPTVPSAGDVFHMLNENMDKNPTRVATWEREGKTYEFAEQVTKIYDATAEFRVTDKRLWPDDYIKCQFVSTEHILNLNEGETAAVIGRLSKASSNVKEFTHCIDITSPELLGLSQ